MSEVQSRPPAARGRGSGRGGRGGMQSTRGGSRTAGRPAAPNGDSHKLDTDSSLPTLEDEGEVGQLKKQYGQKVGFIREIFPAWSDVDILFALKEVDGDENLAVTRISDGSIEQWGEVSKPKKATRPKAKNDTFTTTTADSAPGGGFRPARGGRTDSGRGRGRATERGGRGGARGKSSVPTTNGNRTKETTELSVPTEESSEWNSKPDNDQNSPAPETAAVEATPAAPAAAAPAAVSKPTAAPDNAPSAPKTWASMLRQSTAPKPAPKPKEAPAPKPTEPVIEPLPAAEPAPVEPEPEPVAEPEPAPVEPEQQPTYTAPPPPAVPAVVVPEVALPPSKDQLTETNLEQIADESKPAPEGTARSEATDSWDPRNQAASATATPLSASQQQHQPSRTPVSGFATTATKATERTATRTPSHARRILEQREAVRMPGNRDQVHSAAVQFGAFSFNDEDDIDGDREEPETRAQPPQDSPVAHPRASLPPPQPAQVPEAFPAQKPSATLPPTGPAASAPVAPQAAPTAPSQAVQPPTAPSAQQFGRYGQSAPQETSSFPPSKPFESYGQQQAGPPAAQNQFEGGFPGQAQPAVSQAQQQPGGAFSSAPGDFSAYYTADAQGRNAYNYYNSQAYAQQQSTQGQQDALPSQAQRSFSGYNAQNDSLSQYPQSGVQHAQSARFGAAPGAEAQASAGPTQSQSVAPGQTTQASQAQPHGQQQSHDYGYNHPYYNSTYYSGYMGYGGQGGYNAGYGAPYGKGAASYNHNQYGMNPQGPHGYSSSPAAGFAQSALHRESAVGAGLNDYTRGAPGQSAPGQGYGSSGFGSTHDAFARGASGYQSQTGQPFNAAGPQPGSGPADDLKHFGDAKGASGPSPSLTAAARPGSAANNAPSQTGLPPPQSAQQGGLSGVSGYGGYPSHLQGPAGLHGAQAAAGGYGMSASGGQGQGQSHQNSYGSYGGQGSGYGNYFPNNRGWGNSYH